MTDHEALAGVDLTRLAWTSPSQVVAVTDSGGTIRRANETLVRLAGADVIGSPFAGLAGEGQQDALQEWIVAVGAVWDVRVWGIVPDEQLVPRDFRVAASRSARDAIVIVADPVPAPDVGTAFLEVTQNLVTEQRHLERERDRLGRDAAEDPLTGLANRRAFKARLEREVSDASADAPLALALFDIDHFKAVNDTYGHPAGDDVLRWLGDHLRSHARRSDLVARFGGEEFVAILHGATLAEGTAWAERVRGAIGEDHAPLPTPRVTVSAGVAAWAPGDSGQDLVERADRALYAAKHGGRDRVVADGNVAAGQPSDEELSLPLWEFSSVGLAAVEGLVVRRANRVLTRIIGSELAEVPVGSLVHPEQARAFEAHVAAARESWSKAVFGFAPGADKLPADHVTWVRRHGGITDLVVEPAAMERAAVHESLLSLVEDMIGIQRELERALAGKRAAERRAERLEGMLPVCATCGRVRRPGGTDWIPTTEYLEISHIAVTRTLCDSCTETAGGEQPAR